MKLTVLSVKWGHKNVYGIKKTNSGWYVRYAGISGDCNDRGEPYLFDLLDRDYIDYPASLGDYFSYLWEGSKGKGNDWIQERLDEISRMLMSEGPYEPKDDFWKDIHIQI